MTPQTAATLGRIALSTSFLALLGAWMAQLTGANVLGMSQEHLFSDAIVLSLLGIFGLMDAQLHLQKI